MLNTGGGKAGGATSVDTGQCMGSLGSTFCPAPNSYMGVISASSSSSGSNRFYLASPPALQFMELSLKETVKSMLVGRVQVLLPFWLQEAKSPPKKQDEKTVVFGIGKMWDLSYI